MERYDYYAFIACLITLVVLVGIAGLLAFYGKYSEAIGVSAAITVLIGIMRQPANFGGQVEVVNTKDNPVPIDDTLELKDELDAR